MQSVSESQTTDLTAHDDDDDDDETNEYKNWRTLAVGKEVNSLMTSPFLHPAPVNSQVNVSSAAASWSLDSYHSALELYDSLMDCPDSYIAPHIKHALECINDAYRLYGPESVIGSFNGGKDAVVILELIRAAHAKYYHGLLERNEIAISEQGIGIRPRVIYFNNQKEFPQVLRFVERSVQDYDLDMIAFQEGIGFVDGLKILVENNYLTGQAGGHRVDHTHPMAFVLGTRGSDPNAGKQGTFAPSSSWMPSFMRVNPVLEWTYGHVWHFLRLYKLPYCSLYDEGYTSLGNIEDTLPCPALKKVQLAGTEEEGRNYWPAYMLKDWSKERAGRIKKEKKKKVTDVKIKKGEKTPKKVPHSFSTISLQSSTTSVNIGENVTAAPSAKLSNEVEQGSDYESISSNSTISQRTVGIIVIGDEILKGLTPDTNTHAAATTFRAKNVPLSRVAVVSDSQDDIIAEINLMKQQVDVIITSGGVGPTHDDVTIKSVAEALGSEMVLNEGMAELLLKKMKNGNKEGELKKLSDAQMKMATLPDCSKLRYLAKDDDAWPVLQCENIFILPGVPAFFEEKIELVATYLSTELVRSLTYKVVLSIDENSIVPILNAVVENHPNVSFGSYPFVNHPDFKTVVTLEGRRSRGGWERNSGRYLVPQIEDEEDGGLQFAEDEIDLHVKVALSDLVNGLPAGSVLRVDNDNDLTFS